MYTYDALIPSHNRLWLRIICIYLGFKRIKQRNNCSGLHVCIFYTQTDRRTENQFQQNSNLHEYQYQTMKTRYYAGHKNKSISILLFAFKRWTLFIQHPLNASCIKSNRSLKVNAHVHVYIQLSNQRMQFWIQIGTLCVRSHVQLIFELICHRFAWI